MTIESPQHGSEPPSREADADPPGTKTPEVSSAMKRSLRAAAHHLDPVVMIGDSGLTRAVLEEAHRALEHHQLIKVRVLGDDREERGRIMERMCSVLRCAPIQMIGKLLVIWRPAAETTPPAQKKTSPRKPAKRKADARTSAGRAMSARTSNNARRTTEREATDRKPAGKTSGQPSTAAKRKTLRPTEAKPPLAREGRKPSRSSGIGRPKADATPRAASARAGRRPTGQAARTRTASASAGRPTARKRRTHS
jgi:putative YhbY family RNA-binding protein